MDGSLCFVALVPYIELSLIVLAGKSTLNRVRARTDMPIEVILTINVRDVI